MPEPHSAEIFATPPGGRTTARRLRLAAAAALLAGALGGVPDAAANPGTRSYEPLFDSREIRSANLEPFPKWTGMLDQYFDEKKLEDGPCTAREFNRCHLQEWKAFLETLEGLDRMSQIREVNGYANTHPYILDIVNWGVPDYWATPKEFLEKHGDCEDYAITKYMSLRALGFPNENMRVVVLQDLNLGGPHAVLAVYVDEEPYVLDNQIAQVVKASVIHHYRPYYSINENGWWLHRPM